MLATLRRLTQEVSAAPSLEVALQLIVRQVRRAMRTEVCSVYLLDATQTRYILMATEGLNPAAVGKASLGVTEGLVGLVGTRREPLNLEDAAAHPKFHYIAETGEERFSSFLGAPIIHHRQNLGVLVVQQKERRRFDESEEAFLVTITAQLAGIIAHAKATGAFSVGAQLQKVEAKFSGIPAASGIAMGQAVIAMPLADLDAVPDRRIENIDAEIALFEKALEAVRKDVRVMARRFATKVSPEEKTLFEAYLRILDRNSLGEEVIAVIKQGYWAQGSLRQVITQHVRNFASMEDPYLRERGVDIKDLGRRVLSYLQTAQKPSVIYPPNTILVGEELTASTINDVPEGQLMGLVSVRGSSNSHVVILARAMGIPCVMGVEDLPITQLEGYELILDGYNGDVYFNASHELRKRYDAILYEEKFLEKGLETLKDLPAETTDQHRITLWVNTGLMIDVKRALAHGAEGVGLYRTEIPFMVRDRFPSEEEQRIIYRDQLKTFSPRPVTMRTLDIGGDKTLSYFPIQESNPFLGWRGIRITLDHPEIFLLQVRAMLKANEGLNNLRILLPMISNLSEVEDAQDLIQRAYMEVLLEQGENIPMPSIGVMIEIPAAVYQARELARRVDFLSVGSNDLTQYLLAVDRTNPRVAGLYQAFHPAVLQALQQVVDAAHTCNKPVSICGEIAGEPGAAILLMAMGFDMLSMNASSLARVKWAIRSVSMAQAKDLLKDVMAMDNGMMIRNYMDVALDRLGMGKLVRPKSIV